MSEASTRKRTQTQESQAATLDSSNLPPPRRTSALRRGVAPPLQSTRLSRLIYVLVALTTLLTAFYAYRTVQRQREVGGWWNLALGRKHHDISTGTTYPTSEDTVEDKVNALATALGMPSKELASAIALAVRNYVPPASLSSISAKETGTVVQVLVEGTGEGTENIPTGSPPGVVEGVMHGFENFVGMDEP